MEITQITKDSGQYALVLALLGEFDIHSADVVEFTDTSHGETDVRHNYLIDKTYVLRLNSAKVMTEERLVELDRLIDRYRVFGMKAPRFLKAKCGSYVLERDGMYCYLSEYLDYPLADDVKHRCRDDLRRQRIAFVARFAQAFKGVDLVETVSMYSIFDLAPYDRLNGLNMDEKQENLEQLAADLKQAGYDALARKLWEKNEEIRSQLRPIYKDLPRCVFQGDENFSNLCVNGDDRIIGLFDFNMSGTEVNANYLANSALGGIFFYEDESMEKYTAQEIVRMILEAYRRSTRLTCEHYEFTELEFFAYRLYSKIAMYSAYWNTCAFGEFLKQENMKDKTAQIIDLILDEELSFDEV